MRSLTLCRVALHFVPHFLHLDDLDSCNNQVYDLQDPKHAMNRSLSVRYQQEFMFSEVHEEEATLLAQPKSDLPPKWDLVVLFH